MMSRFLSLLLVSLVLFCSTVPVSSVNILDTLKRLSKRGESLSHVFKEDIPEHFTHSDIQKLEEFVDWPENDTDEEQKETIKSQNADIEGPSQWKALFKKSGLTLEDKCFTSKEKFYYRSMDGSCNWIQQGESWIGSTGTRMWRDYNQTAYKDGISEPRDGPNAREVSNEFFKRKKHYAYNHKPILLGFVEFLIHDIVYSNDSKEPIVTPVPRCDPAFDPKCTGKETIVAYRTEKLNGTGTSRENPRENTNECSAWMDMSPLYGSDDETARKLRSFKSGKLLAQTGADGREYLPFNTMGVPTKTRSPHQDPSTLFAGGDPRTNQDWVLLGIHTLFLREHNRLCDILVQKYPHWDEEKLYQGARMILGAKYYVMLLQYASSYYTPEFASIPGAAPIYDGLGLFRIAMNASFSEVNLFHGYPWKYNYIGGNTKGNIFVSSQEMSLGYRFHDLIIPSFNLTNARYQPTEEIDLAKTQMDAKGFLNASLSDILRGMSSTGIPNFHSGVDENFRSAKWGGRNFDLALLSVVHERERGLPTFNQYFRENNKYYKNGVRIREKFEDFSSDKEVVAALKRLYPTPDHVDLTVGIQLDEDLFPGITIPASALMTSLIGIFGVGSVDRFGLGLTQMRCLLIDKPWNCKPANLLDEIMWAPKPSRLFPNKRWLDPFWLNELKLFSSQNPQKIEIFWQMVRDNTDIQCLPLNPFFPLDEKTNPMVCGSIQPEAMPAIMSNLGYFTSAALKIWGSGISIGFVIGGLLALCCGWKRWGKRKQQISPAPSMPSSTNKGKTE